MFAIALLPMEHGGAGEKGSRKRPSKMRLPGA
jgi:hypothetical protein